MGVTGGSTRRTDGQHASSHHGDLSANELGKVRSDRGPIPSPQHFRIGRGLYEFACGVSQSHGDRSDRNRRGLVDHCEHVVNTIETNSAPGANGSDRWIAWRNSILLADAVSATLVGESQNARGIDSP